MKRKQIRRLEKILRLAIAHRDYAGNLERYEHYRNVVDKLEKEYKKNTGYYFSPTIK